MRTFALKDNKNGKKMEKPLILICNDDGIKAPGLMTLIDCVKDMAEVVCVAPDDARSGQSSAMTFNQPLRINKHENYHGAEMYSVSGTPVDCVKLAMHNILDRKPDMMLSGINHGSNAGCNIIYSGTMGAAMEACMAGIPSVGFSILSHAWDADLSECVPLIKGISAAVLKDGLPDGVCLNVNFPAATAIKGLKSVRAARSHWTEEYRRYEDPHGKPFYWLTGSIINEEPDDAGTDLYWLDRGYGTVVPARPDQNATDQLGTIEKLIEEAAKQG